VGIEDIPFVWGPIGGLKQISGSLSQGADLKLQLLIVSKQYNLLQLKYDYRVNQAFKRAKFANEFNPCFIRSNKKIQEKESLCCFPKQDYL
jgi:hypothetical protein